VFCRNVLIYFDQETKVDVFERIAKLMTPDGFLVLGAAETVVGLTDAFKPLPDQRGLYAPNAVKAGAKVASFGQSAPRLVVAGARYRRAKRCGSSPPQCGGAARWRGCATKGLVPPPTCCDTPGTQ